MNRSGIIVLLWGISLCAFFIAGGSWLAAWLLIATAAVLALSVINSIFVGKKIEAEICVPDLIQKNQTFEAEIRLKNQSILPISHGYFQLIWKNTLTKEKGEQRIYFGLKGKGTSKLRFTGSSHYCGGYQFEIKECYCSDFLKLIRRKRIVSVQGYTVAVPEYADLNLELFVKESYDMESFRFSETHSGDDPSETFDIREYQPGDSVKQIHWKLSEKLDSVVIRERSFPVYNSILLLPELFQTEYSSQQVADALAEVFCSAAFTLLHQNVSFDIGFFGEGSEQFCVEHIDTEEKLWNSIFHLLQNFTENGMSVVEEYSQMYSDRKFAHYVYIHGNEESAYADMLRSFGEVTEMICSAEFSADRDRICFTQENWKTELA